MGNGLLEIVNLRACLGHPTQRGSIQVLQDVLNDFILGGEAITAWVNGIALYPGLFPLNACGKSLWTEGVSFCVLGVTGQLRCYTALASTLMAKSYIMQLPRCLPNFYSLACTGKKVEVNANWKLGNEARYLKQKFSMQAGAWLTYVICTTGASGLSQLPTSIGSLTFGKSQRTQMLLKLFIHWVCKVSRS